MIRTCKACGQHNRVPAKHLSDRGRCGKCKAELPPVAEPLSVDAQAFDDIVQHAKVPLLVDFWAQWCGPCRMAAPHLEQVAAQMAGRALVLKVNTEQEPGLAQRFRVQSIPNFVVLHGGRTVLQQPGLVDARQMRDWLERAA